MISAIVFGLLGVGLPLMVWAGQRGTRATLLAIDDTSRRGLYRHQAVFCLAVGVVACVPLMVGEAGAGDYGLMPRVDRAAVWITAGLAGAYWLGLRWLVCLVARRAGVRAWVRRFFRAEVHALLPARRDDMGWWAAVSAGAGIGEELAFRAFMIWFLSPLIGAWWAVVLGAVLFAMMHAWEGWRAVLIIVAMSVGLGAMLVWSGSLYPLIVLHAAHNWEMGRAWLALQRAEQGAAGAGA